MRTRKRDLPRIKRRQERIVNCLITHIDLWKKYLNEPLPEKLYASDRALCNTLVRTLKIYKIISINTSTGDVPVDIYLRIAKQKLKEKEEQ